MIRAGLAVVAAKAAEAVICVAQSAYPTSRCVSSLVHGRGDRITAREIRAKFAEPEVPVTVENVAGRRRQRRRGDSVAKSTPDGTKSLLGRERSATINPTMYQQTYDVGAILGRSRGPVMRASSRSTTTCRPGLWRLVAARQGPQARQAVLTRAPGSRRQADSTSPAKCSRGRPGSTSCSALSRRGLSPT